MNPKKEDLDIKKEKGFPFLKQNKNDLTEKGEVMRSSKTHSVTIKKQLSKCRSVFNSYNNIQYAYGIKLDSNADITDIKCNVKLSGCSEGENYTTDFYCISKNAM